MSVNGPILHEWQYVQRGTRDIVVLPDGCRDLIIRIPPDGKPALLYPELDDRAVQVCLAPGARLFGFRLRPGARFPTALLRQLRHEFTQHLDDDRMRHLARDAIHAETDLGDELLGAIQSTSSVDAAARRLGVSVRTLHRHLLHVTDRPPSFWFDLARARRALAALASEAGLAEIAADAGYADQPHMTRSFRYRFGATPARFRADARLMRLAGHSGFAG
ncbi:AraC family transcriptional regulator [Devosia lacusdianchii]|uniref:AraC family transcriptional regulator n=1 Tax=Devosia lacusdianchii TaxID=2917991 RepID=UPI001F054B93|nr:helix-turn-helix domain-containing protein [Devosia sp. JXJ CY 41]